MLRLRDPQESLWDQVLPPQARTLSAELTGVDAYLADDRFFEPYRQRFRTLIGRPTVPVETYLRLMYLKHRYRLGYEMLVREVTDSLHWRRFCHLTLDAPVPHPTTLSKLTRKYGPDVVRELNRLLVQQASERKLVRSRKLRVDTTVVQAPIDYPTDIGLLADSARVVTRTVRQLQAAGVAVRTAFRSRARTIKRSLAAVGRSLRLRTEEAKAAVLTQTARVLRCTRQISRQAQRVLHNSRRIGQQRSVGATALVQRMRLRLRHQLQLTVQIMGQARARIGGTTTIPDRLVSVFDPEARPIRRGKLSAKTEFGYKALLTETEARLVTHYEVYAGNPQDGCLLPTALAGHTQTIPGTRTSSPPIAGLAPRTMRSCCATRTSSRSACRIKEDSAPPERRMNASGGSGDNSGGAAGRKRRSVWAVASTSGDTVACEVGAVRTRGLDSAF